MLGLAGVPSALMLLGMIFMPESPRWLVFHGREEKAKRALAKVRAATSVEAELESIKEDFEKQKKFKLGELPEQYKCLYSIFRNATHAHAEIMWFCSLLLHFIIL